MTGATYEGGALSSLLPHLDEQSTFNRRAGEALSQRSIHRDGPREAYYQGSSSAPTHPLPPHTSPPPPSPHPHPCPCLCPHRTAQPPPGLTGLFCRGVQNAHDSGHLSLNTCPSGSLVLLFTAQHLFADAKSGVDKALTSPPLSSHLCRLRAYL